MIQNKLKFVGDCIEIHCDRTDYETMTMVSNNFYPVHKNRINTLFKVSLRLIPEVLEVLRGINGDNINTAPPQIQKLWLKEMEARHNLEVLKQGHYSGNPKISETLTLDNHQQIAREIALVRDRFGLFYDTRTGKTPISLSIIYDDISKNPDHKWLVVCPLILIETAWLEDVEKFFPNVKYINCHDTTKQKRLDKLKKEANLYICNTESFSTYKEYYEQIGFHGCIVDESSSMRSAKSKQSKALVEFSRTVKRWYLLSGTPAPNNEDEYYMQLMSIDYYSVPSSMTAFHNYYFANVSFNPQYPTWVIRPDMQQIFMDHVKQYSIYVDKEDVLRTPGRDFHEILYDLDPNVQKVYNEMKRHLAVELQDVIVLAPSAAAKCNKLNQITSGFLIDTEAVKQNKNFDEGLQEVHLLSMQRFDILVGLLQQHPGEQVLIWANYKEEIKRIKELLGYSCMCVYGDTSYTEKMEAIKRFKKRELQYLVANPASADKGLTLTNCHICIYFSLNYSYETFKQSMERIYADISRQPKRCIYYIIMANKTIDEVLYREVLQNKQGNSYAILNHLKGAF